MTVHHCFGFCVLGAAERCRQHARGLAWGLIPAVVAFGGWAACLNYRETTEVVIATSYGCAHVLMGRLKISLPDHRLRIRSAC